eukprot:3813703-Rhodomonas_salina.1
MRSERCPSSAKSRAASRMNPSGPQHTTRPTPPLDSAPSTSCPRPPPQRSALRLNWDRAPPQAPPLPSFLF